MTPWELRLGGALAPSLERWTSTSNQGGGGEAVIHGHALVGTLRALDAVADGIESLVLLEFMQLPRRGDDADAAAAEELLRPRRFPRLRRLRLVLGGCSTSGPPTA